MSQFWIGYLAAIATYLVIGFCVGVGLIWTHLAYFFAAGWQVKRMLYCIGMNMLVWPTTVLVEISGGDA